MNRNRPVPARRLVGLLAGFVVWASGLVVVYGVNALGCAFDWPSGTQRAGLLALSAAHLAVIVAVARGLSRRRGRAADEDGDRDGEGPGTAESGPWLDAVALRVTWAAGAATLLTLLPAAFTTMCSP